MGRVYLTGAGPGDIELLTMKAARGELLRSARESDYPAAYGCFAQWAIGLRYWATDQRDEALSCFQQCAETGQFEFPHHAWSRAILRIATTAAKDAADAD